MVNIRDRRTLLIILGREKAFTVQGPFRNIVNPQKENTLNAIILSTKRVYLSCETIETNAHVDMLLSEMLGAGWGKVLG